MTCLSLLLVAVHSAGAATTPRAGRGKGLPPGYRKVSERFAYHPHTRTGRFTVLATRHAIELRDVQRVKGTRLYAGRSKHGVQVFDPDTGWHSWEAHPFSDTDIVKLGDNLIFGRAGDETLVIQSGVGFPGVHQTFTRGGRPYVLIGNPEREPVVYDLTTTREVAPGQLPLPDHIRPDMRIRRMPGGRFAFVNQGGYPARTSLDGGKHETYRTLEPLEGTNLYVGSRNGKRYLVDPSTGSELSFGFKNSRRLAGTNLVWLGAEKWRGKWDAEGYGGQQGSAVLDLGTRSYVGHSILALGGTYFVKLRTGDIYNLATGRKAPPASFEALRNIEARF